MNKKKLILFMAYPVKTRYQEWWFYEFPKQLKKYFDVILLGEDIISNNNRGNIKNFSPISEALKFEAEQIKLYHDLDIDYNNDILFFSDLSFQEASISQLFYKKPKNCFSFCHGTSKNKYDLFQKDRKSKWKCETGHSELFNKVFVSTNYHKEKLKWKNIEVLGLPKNPYIKKNLNYNNNDNKIISVSRPCIQKVNKKLEKRIEVIFDIKIKRQVFNHWNDYCNFLSKSFILLISSKEDTFNYTILDSLECGCIPIAPNNLCFPEILPDYLLYNNLGDLVNIIDTLRYHNINTSNIELKNKNLIDNFYKNLSVNILNNLR